jgi:NAD(P)-dependent dehydrogenase (short-subunit alcohol dehydrogenase family)
MEKKIALVTGANRGIGFETCRQLGQRGFRVVLTSRNHILGAKAAEILRHEGLEIVFHQLDVTAQDQVSRVRDLVVQEYDSLDVLINNAGVSLDGGASVFDVAETVFEETLAVNFYGPMRMTRAFIPTMKRNDYGRVVNVSSALGSLEAMGNLPGQTAAYRVSKAALNALTRLMAGGVKEYNIKINAVCPGWVRTRMGGSRAPREVAVGVDTIVWLATLPASGPTGGFFKDRKRHPW